MVREPRIHNHAVIRLDERFGVDESWLLNELENGRFVWLKGMGDAGSQKNVRSGHLIYIPDINEFCVVVMDNRSRIAITVLTEEMASKSSWGAGLDDSAKLKAKRIALGEDVIKDSNFILLYALERGALQVHVRARTISFDWKPITVNICKIKLKPEQIDVESNSCTLSDDQQKVMTISIKQMIDDNQIRAYCDFMISTGSGKTASVTNKLDGISNLKEASNVMRWFK